MISSNNNEFCLILINDSNIQEYYLETVFDVIDLYNNKNEIKLFLHLIVQISNKLH